MSAVNTQFSIAVHIMSNLGFFVSMTSDKLSRSVNTNSAFVRRTLTKLSKAGLITTTRGKAGSCMLARKAKDITLFDIYTAVQAPKAFAIHQYPEWKPCIVSRNVKDTLNDVLCETQKLVEKNLKSISLSEVVLAMQTNDKT